MNTFDERNLLKLSIVATLIIASLGIALGLLSGSFSIAFDGVYSLADASMTALALWISSLIFSSARRDLSVKRPNDRFTMGFWHLEPIVLLLNGTLLVGVVTYALVTAIANILGGGHLLRFDLAILYAVLTLAICAVMALVERKANLNSVLGSSRSTLRRGLCRAGFPRLCSLPSLQGMQLVEHPSNGFRPIWTRPFWPLYAS